MQKKYQSVIGSIPVGSTDTRVKLRDISLDEIYETVTGIAFTEIGDSGEDFQLEVSDNDRIYVDLISKELLVAGSGVSPNDKYLDVTFPTPSKKVNIYIKPLATTTNEIKIETVFRTVSKD